MLLVQTAISKSDLPLYTLIGYRKFLVEKNAFVNPAVSGESQKSTYKYRPVHIYMQTSSQMKGVL